MADFLNSVLSFPTIVFSFFLCLCVVLWLFTAVGLLGLEVGDADLDADLDVSDLGAGGSTMHDVGEAVGFLSRFGLHGVPITLVLTLLSLFGWVISFIFQVNVLNIISIPLLYYSLGLLVMLLSLVVSVFLTAKICKPLRLSFRSQEALGHHSFIGREAIVRSSVVTMTYGEAVMDDGGAGLIFRIRAEDSQGLKHGDKVVLLEYLNDLQAYLVVSEDEFRGI